MGLANATLHLLRHELREGRAKGADVVSLGVPEVQGYADHRTFFDEFGCGTVTTIDASDWESPDKIHDMGEPIPREWHETADLVIDPGTCEHVFNFPVCLANVLAMLRIGGMAFHHTPLNWVNHGYYCISPCCWREWYERHGCTVELYQRRGGDMSCQPLIVGECQTMTLEPAGQGWLMCIVATKHKRVARKPMIQRRYLRHKWQEGKAGI